MDSHIFTLIGWIFGGGLTVMLVTVFTIRYVIRGKREETNQAILRTEADTVELNNNLRESLNGAIDTLAKYAAVISRQANEHLEQGKQLEICLTELESEKRKNKT